MGPKPKVYRVAYLEKINITRNEIWGLGGPRADIPWTASRQVPTGSVTANVLDTNCFLSGSKDVRISE